MTEQNTQQEELNNRESKKFGLTNLSVNNSTSVLLITFMIFLFGLMGYSSMPKESFPEISFPQVFINTVYFGNSAQDIENLITRPIEKELQQITGIKNINSTSLQDYSVIIAEFETDVDIDDAVRLTKDAVDMAKSELPTDLDAEPIVDDINFSEIPIMTVNISGDMSQDELKNYAEYLQDEIEDLKEITDVEMKGAMEREMKIQVDLVQMEAREVSFGDIAMAIANENITMSGGEIVKDHFRRAIRVVGEFKDAEEIKNVIIKSENLAPVYLRDVATVEFGYKDRTSIARSNGLPVISLDVIKRSGENLLFAADKIQALIKKAEDEVFPEEVSVQIFNDQSNQTRTQVENLENSIISGVILVILVLLFFLGFRNSMFVGIAIPLSMLMGILILNAAGVTMNMVVLFSLILALGLLVDNAIVVVENIYRHMQEGYTGIEAAKRGAGEVALPIIASTATTLAAFVPLAFWPGIMGEFMKFLPITLIIVLASSLFVALVINPVLTSLYMRVEDTTQASYTKKGVIRNLTIFAVLIVLSVIFHFADVEAMRNLCVFVAGFLIIYYFLLRPASFYFQNKVLPILEKAYDKFIHLALKIPIAIFIGSFLMLFGSFALFGKYPPKIDLFPKAQPLYVNAFIEMPLGTDIDATDEVASRIEKKIEAAVESYGAVVESVLTQIGENTGDPNQPPEPGASPHKARITVAFVQSKERGGVNTYDIMEAIRDVITGNPGVQITVDQNADGPPVGKPINLEITGENIDELTTLSEKLKAYLNSKNIPGIEELLMDVKLGKPELLINVDREAARRYGISTIQIADAIRTSVFGKEVSKYKIGEDEYDITVRLDDKYRYEANNLINQKITFRSASNGQIIQIPISAVCDLTYSSTYNSIKRKNLDRMITIYSNVLEGYNAAEIVTELTAAMNNYDLPNGYGFEFTGEQQEAAENMEFLFSALMIAIFAIFIIIVSQFNSIISPFIIILSVVFSLIGVLLGYVITSKDVSIVMTGVGVISLAGVVVNNAIVLIDYIYVKLRESIKMNNVDSLFDLSKKEVRGAIAQAGATRLRPVLLTAVTTVLGLVPLATGFNLNFFTLISRLDPQIFYDVDNVAMWGPMAWTVIYGLVFATFLTLIVVPSMFYLSFIVMNFFKRTFST